MKTEELKRNNYLINYQGKLCKILGLPNDESVIMEAVETKEVITGGIKYASPIPLSPEVLIAANFNQIENVCEQFDAKRTYPAYQNGIIIALIDKEYKLWIDIDEDRFYSFPWTTITSLHELQNLYYSLQRHELQINQELLKYAIKL